MDIILEEVECPFCHSKNYKKLFKNEDWLYGVNGEYQVVECKDCKWWYQNPQPVKSSISDCYPEEYGPYSRIKRIDRFAHTLSMIESYNQKCINKYTKINKKLLRMEPEADKNGKILEIGCADGSRLFQLQDKGYKHLYGIDISSVSEQKMLTRGISFQCGDITDIIKTYNSEQFDTVIISMVLEHLKNPIEVLDEIERIIHPGGELLISTITRDCLDWTIFRKNAVFFDLPRHMIYFTKKQLLNIFHERFEEVSMATQNFAFDMYRSSRTSKNILGWFMTYFMYTIPGHFINVKLAQHNRASRVFFRCKKR